MIQGDLEISLDIEKHIIEPMLASDIIPKIYLHRLNPFESVNENIIKVYEPLESFSREDRDTYNQLIEKAK